MDTTKGTPPGVLAANLRAEMARKNYTQFDLSEVLGCHRTAASRRMTGQVPLTTPELAIVIKWLDVPASAILEEQHVR